MTDTPCHRAFSSTYCTTHDVEWPMDGLFRCPAVRQEAADPSGLREALLMFGHEYDVAGRMEWHSYNCTYRKTWPMFDGDTSQDEPQCIAARAALEGATERPLDVEP